MSWNFLYLFYTQLQALSGVPPLSIEHDQLTLHFYYKLNSSTKHPTYSTVLINNSTPLFQRIINTIQPLNLHLLHKIQTINPYNNSVAEYKLS